MAELYHYGTKRHSGRYPWGSGNRPFQREVDSKDSRKIANELYSTGIKKEPIITKNVQNAVRETNAHMYGLEHRLKTLNSIDRKIQTDSIEKSVSLKDSANNIKDVVRYTTISSNNDFVKNYNTFKAYLELRGYTEERCRNYFEMYKEGKVKHKSVQSVFSDPEGYLFEVQFQTKESQEAKDKKVPIYEERRKPGLSKKREEQLEAMMIDLAEKVPYPKDISKIKSH